MSVKYIIYVLTKSINSLKTNSKLSEKAASFVLTMQYTIQPEIVYSVQPNINTHAIHTESETFFWVFRPTRMHPRQDLNCCCNPVWALHYIFCICRHPRVKLQHQKLTFPCISWHFKILVIFPRPSQKSWTFLHFPGKCLHCNPRRQGGLYMISNNGFSAKLYPFYISAESLQPKSLHGRMTQNVYVHISNSNNRFPVVLKMQHPLSMYKYCKPC